ncbi:unnamed protein product [Simian adenovirus 31]
MSKRKIKEEMLQVIAPEIYGPPKKEEQDFKSRKIKRVKKKKKDDDADGEVEFLRATAPRRPVQWKGRRVKRVLRPGTAVVFTPGERSTRTFKRVYDEVYGDEDLLEQANERFGEFAYGKRQRPLGKEDEDLLALPLDRGNPTPSLKPVTLQQVLPSSAPSETKRGLKREGGDLAPTVQLMVPKRQRLEDVLEKMKVDPGLQPDIRVRPIKQVAPGLGVQTVDVVIPTGNSPAAATTTTATSTDMETQTVPAAAAAAAATAATSSAEVQTDPWLPPAMAPRARRGRRKYGAANALLPEYALHPSIAPTPGYRGYTYRPRRAKGSTRRPRRRAATTRRRRRSRRQPALAPISVRRVARDGRTLVLPRARYHPSIV